MERNGKLGAIHMLKARLRYDDSAYRSLLSNCYGVTTAAKLTDTQMTELIKYLNVQLAKTKSPTTKHKSNHELIDKIRAIWISMGKDGFIKNASEQNLQVWIKRMFGLDNINWLSLDEMARAIEALKKWNARELKKRETENGKKES